MSSGDMLLGLKPLIPAQLNAVEPGNDIWLSASAGTGKTQVLTARVIRLLLTDTVRPENLLCITFTKAGAAEMAERINKLLASWVQMKDELLALDLKAIGADYGPETKTKARQLFAAVLDAPGGGLQILTIHSFCQSILGSFPEEAGLIPGFKPIEGREQGQLLREALSEMIIKAERHGDDDLIESLQSMSLAMGEEAAFKFLQKCAAVPDVMADIPDDKGAVVWSRSVAEVRFDGSLEEAFEAKLSDSYIDRHSILAIAEMNREWGTARGNARAEKISEWLALDAVGRGETLESLHSCWWNNSKDEPQIQTPGQVPKQDQYSQLALDLAMWTKGLLEEFSRAAYAERLAKALLVGKAFADEYGKAKQVRGVVDFDDMIRKTAGLLNNSNMADWVRYKLDRAIDHILVDESQDTNKAQWDIIRALSNDFYSGAGAKSPDKLRTIFSVGDFKQAIYGFQGTAPERYQEAGEGFAKTIKDAGRELQKLGLSQSFRSTPPILDFVNAMIGIEGHEAFGIIDAIKDHFSDMPHAGLIELLYPVTAEQASNDADNDNDTEENWATPEKRRLAKLLARHAKALIDEAPYLATKDRKLEPRDIMFLLRSRGELASLLVAQLHEQKVPVAGIDRLRLLQPLVVQDLLATIRFVLQPEDDLSLACIMVSPLIGWTQDDLLKYGYRGASKISLWQHLRAQPEIADVIAPLYEMLNAADFTTVYHFLEQILSGPTAGRRKFAARLGAESLVPMEEMLNAAIQFEQQQGGGLQNFLHWFDSGEIEIKREGESGANEVRVMTVHGAKGLQAPVIILADTTSDPTKKPDRSAELIVDDGKRTPLLPIRKSEESGRLAKIVEKQKAREKQEHMRLLYVAVTRAEERLIMAGSLGVRSKGAAPDESWFMAIERAMTGGLGIDWEDDTRWTRVMRYRGNGEASAIPMIERTAATVLAKSIDLPAWLHRPAPNEQRPPRPLAPSRLDDDDYGNAPATLSMRLAAERGNLVHALFERVEGQSLTNASRWLDSQMVDDGINKHEILAQVSTVVGDEYFAVFFGANARSEVPLSAVVGEIVVSGRVDRLVIEPGLIRVLDFKSGRAVPDDETGVSIQFIRQMAHYVAALEMIFPESTVEASLLYTYEPRLITLSDAILAPHKPLS